MIVMIINFLIMNVKQIKTRQILSTKAMPKHQSKKIRVGYMNVYKPIQSSWHRLHNSSSPFILISTISIYESRSYLFPFLSSKSSSVFFALFTSLELQLSIAFTGLLTPRLRTCPNHLKRFSFIVFFIFASPTLFLIQATNKKETFILEQYGRFKLVGN